MAGQKSDVLRWNIEPAGVALGVGRDGDRGGGRPQRSAHRDIDKFFEAELVGVVLPQMAPHVPDDPRVIVRPP